MESGSTEMGVNAGTLLTAVAVTAKELAVLGVYSVGARLRGWMFSVLSNRLASAVGRSVGRLFRADAVAPRCIVS